MRLREPFSGYKLTSGHYMFHIAFFFGSFLIKSYGENVQIHDKHQAERILFLLRLAHVLVPFFNVCIWWLETREYWSMSKVFEVISIF